MGYYTEGMANATQSPRTKKQKKKKLSVCLSV